MQSTKPYLIRAIHEWCLDQGFTPYLAVSVDATTRVPREFVKDGEIVLNVGADATHQMNLGNDEINFQARFNGRPYPVVVPIERVMAIYARENGQGMAFEVGDANGSTALEAVTDEHADSVESEEAPVVAEVAAIPIKPSRSHLTRIK
jgi:stringent starvation protein B